MINFRPNERVSIDHRAIVYVTEMRNVLHPWLGKYGLIRSLRLHGKGHDRRRKWRLIIVRTFLLRHETTRLREQKTNDFAGILG